eukprot:scaffold2696_cov390-Prasinococcus_capsulatus_cf.AAC.3
MLDANNRVAWYTAPGDHFSGLVTYSTSSQLAKCGSILKAFGTFPDLYRDNKAPTPWYTSIALSSKPALRPHRNLSLIHRSYARAVSSECLHIQQPHNATIERGEVLVADLTVAGSSPPPSHR